MKRLLFVFLLMLGSARAVPLPGGADVSFELKGADKRVLEITPTMPVTMVLTFSNPTKSRVKVQIDDRSPRDRREPAPYPIGCAVRVTDTAGNLHPDAKGNGEWWTQYICWSVGSFRSDDKPPLRTLKPGEKFSYDVSLAAVLAVPAGGEPEGWAWQSSSGFLPGRHLFQFRFNDAISEQFTLIVRARE